MITNEEYESLAYPGVYTDENEIIPYSPRRKFGFTSPISEITNEEYESLAYPGVYTDENEIIPYSPRRKFGFTSHTSDIASDKIEEFLDESKIIKLESMEHMSIDQIVQLYRYGYKIEDIYPTIETAQEGIYISTGALLLGVGIIALIYYLKK